MANNIAQVLLVLAIAFLHSRQKRKDARIIMGVPLGNPDGEGAGETQKCLA